MPTPAVPNPPPGRAASPGQPTELAARPPSKAARLAASASQQGASLPYTDAFKLCRVDTWPKGDYTKAGDVRVEVDRTVGRQVVRLAGAVPAANSLRLPKEGSLGLSGRFLYIQVQLAVSKTYAINVEFLTADNSLQRLSISNLCKQDDVRMKRSGIHVYMPAEDDSWAMLALDMQALAKSGCSSAFSRVRAVQLCANMAVRTVISSNIKYDWESLPRDLAVTAAFDAKAAKVVWIPEEPIKDVQVAAPSRRPTLPLPAVPKQPPIRKESAGEGALSSMASVFEELQEAGPALEPNPIMHLQHMNVFSGEFVRGLLWAHGEMLFPAGPTIIAMKGNGGGQRHLLAHSRPVVALALDSAGDLLASGEEGPGGSIKLWDVQQGKCFATVAGHVGGLICLDLSPDGQCLVSAGMDAHGKQELVLWDVSQCRAGSKPAELARHITDYSVKCLKFVPFEPDKLLACGKNSIRVYRVKDNQLRGLSVPMDGVQALRKPYSCGTLADPANSAVGEIFTDVAFEHNPQLLPIATRRAYVTTFSGALYQVNLDLRVVEAVHQLHSAGINAITLRHGFCATGCGQGMLRVWGLDFQEVFMEVELEGSVTGVAFSPDGLQIAAGTEVGSLGALSIASHKFTALLRSHTGAVHAVAVEPSGQQFYTGAADGTVRAWDVATRQQLLEFFAPGEAVRSVACHPTRAEVACGFGSGSVRVFDVAAATMMQECRQHTGVVTRVVYAQRGQILLSMGEDGNVCAHDARRGYLPLKYLALGPGLAASCLAMSQDGHTIAVGAYSASSDQSVVMVFAAASLDPTLQFPLPRYGSSTGPGTALTQLHFLPDGRHLLGITADGRLLGFNSKDGSLVASVLRLHGKECCTASAVDKSGSYLVTGGADRVVKVWGLHALHHALLPQGTATAPEAGNLAAAADGVKGSQQEEQQQRLVRCLPCQSFAGHPDVVLGVTFLDDGEVVSVGAQDALCFWAFAGQRCNTYPAGPRDASTSTVVISPLNPAQPVLQGLAATTAQATEADTAVATTTAAGGEVAAAGAEEAQPSLVAALQPQRSAWPAGQQLLRRGASSPAGSCTVHAPGPSSPGAAAEPAAEPAAAARSSSRPFWERPSEGPSNLVVTASHRGREAYTAPMQQQLVITAPGTSSGGSSSGGEGQRSAEWVLQQQPGIPPFRPEDQLQLMPPHAEVQRVYGFNASAGVAWNGDGNLAYAAGNALLVGGIRRGEQRTVAYHTAAITAIAGSAAGSWLAAALEPSESGAADIVMYSATHERRWVLQCHAAAVRQLIPSPDDSLLVSLGSSPPEPLALWDLTTGELVAMGLADQSPQTQAYTATVASMAWLPGARQPTFYTVSTTGLCHWSLGPKALIAEDLPLPEPLRGAALQSVACGGGQRPDGGCSLMLGDCAGRLWVVELNATQDIVSFALLAELQEDSITAVYAAASGDIVAAGTAKGLVAVLQQQEGAWGLVGRHQLDGQVCTLGAQPDDKALVAVTEASTLWQLQGASAAVLLCGHRHAITGLQHCAGLMATSSLAGVHVWQLGEQGPSSSSGPSMAPLLEFLESPGPSCVSIAHNRSCAAAGYSSGAVSLYDLASSRLRWRAAALQPHPVVGVAVLERLRAIRVMVVYRNGAIYVLDGNNGYVLQHTLQYGVHEPGAAGEGAGGAAAALRAGRSQNFPIAGLVVCPTDSTLFALLGSSAVIVCKSTWAKHSGCQTLARLRPAGQDANQPPTGEQLHQPPPAVAFSDARPGHLYCAFFPGHQPATIELHDYSNGSIVKTMALPASGAATALAVSTGDGLLAVGTAGGTVLLMRGNTEAWAELQGHGACPVQGLHFSRCGKKLWSVAGSTVFGWEVKS